jgi:hypothetical protein
MGWLGIYVGNSEVGKTPAVNIIQTVISISAKGLATAIAEGISGYESLSPPTKLFGDLALEASGVDPLSSWDREIVDMFPASASVCVRINMADHQIVVTRTQQD